MTNTSKVSGLGLESLLRFKALGLVSVLLAWLMCKTLP